MRIRRRDQRGVVLPTSVMFLSILAVAAAAFAFLLTAQPQQPEQVVPVAQAKPSATVQATLKPKPRPKPAVNKAQTFVEVYNNSNIGGLAGRVAGQARDSGWNVVGSDNWYGTVGTSTVYYPQRLEAAAKMLAKDLRIGRVKTAIAPMRFDRLTVVLTGDYR